jgi:drug/metabolite transporter (DMT)-like permease
MSLPSDSSGAAAIARPAEAPIPARRWSAPIGALLIALSAASFGAMAIFARIAYGSGANVSGVLLIRFSLAGGLLLLLLRLSGRRLPRGRPLLVCAAMGGIGYVGQALAYFSALQHASAGLVALLLYLYPVLVGLLAALFLGEAMTWRKAALLALSFVGSVLTIGAGGGSLQGILLGIACALIYSLYILVGGRYLGGVDAIGSSTVVCLSAAAVMGALGGLMPPRLPSGAGGWAAVAGIALISTVVAIWAFLAGMQRLGAGRAAILSTLEPVVTVLLAALCLQEPLLPLQLAGGALILAAAVLVMR